MTDAAGTVEMPRPKIAERAAADRGGWTMLGVALLLVVLCADRDAQPVVNTGTLYQ